MSNKYSIGYKLVSAVLSLCLLAVSLPLSLRPLPDLLDLRGPRQVSLFLWLSVADGLSICGTCVSQSQTSLPHPPWPGLRRGNRCLTQGQYGAGAQTQSTEENRSRMPP